MCNIHTNTNINHYLYDSCNFIDKDNVIFIPASISTGVDIDSLVKTLEIIKIKVGEA